MRYSISFGGYENQTWQFMLIKTTNLIAGFVSLLSAFSLMLSQYGNVHLLVTMCKTRTRRSMATRSHVITSVMVQFWYGLVARTYNIKDTLS